MQHTSGFRSVGGVAHLCGAAAAQVCVPPPPGSQAVCGALLPPAAAAVRAKTYLYGKIQTTFPVHASNMQFFFIRVVFVFILYFIWCFFTASMLDGAEGVESILYLRMSHD